MENEFKEPWKNSETAIVIDPYEGNQINWEQFVTDTRVVGIIHQATRGLNHKDSQYKEYKAIAKGKGYKWGSYHLGRKGDPIEQAKIYLDFAEPEDDEIMALDIETLNTDVDMSLSDAKKFIEHIKDQTGRYPMLYANQAVTKEASSKHKNDEIFTKVRLWYARFKTQVTDFPQGIWETYTFWQFACEINCAVCTKMVNGKCTKRNCNKSTENCPYKVPGTDRCMDVNVFNGTIEDLRQNWAQIGK